MCIWHHPSTLLLLLLLLGGTDCVAAADGMATGMLLLNSNGMEITLNQKRLTYRSAVQPQPQYSRSTATAQSLLCAAATTIITLNSHSQSLSWLCFHRHPALRVWL